VFELKPLSSVHSHLELPRCNQNLHLKGKERRTLLKTHYAEITPSFPGC
jgi:hypothetical protein